jgi:hypothetical protein
VLDDMDDAICVDTLASKSGKAAASATGVHPHVPNFLPHLTSARQQLQILRSTNPKKMDATGKKRKSGPDDRDKGGQNKRARVGCF